MPLPLLPDLSQAKRARLGLISDTHVFPNGARVLSPHVLDLFRRAEVDLIVHAGDVACAEVLDGLATVAPVVAVRGNNDHGAFGDTLPMVLDFRIVGHKVRVLHGHGQAGSARREAVAKAPGNDIVIFGHSHVPLIERVGEAILVNPGSPTDRRFQPYFSVALLDIGPDKIWPEIILFEHVENLAAAKLPER